MRLALIKALVLGMGVAILVVFGLIVLAMTRESSDEPPVAARGGSQTVELPAGAQVLETAVGDGRIVLRLRLAEGEEVLKVLDARSGTAVRDIRLVPSVPR